MNPVYKLSDDTWGEIDKFLPFTDQLARQSTSHGMRALSSRIYDHAAPQIRNQELRGRFFTRRQFLLRRKFNAFSRRVMQIPAVTMSRYTAFALSLIIGGGLKPIFKNMFTFAYVMKEQCTIMGYTPANAVAIPIIACLGMIACAVELSRGWAAAYTNTSVSFLVIVRIQAYALDIACSNLYIKTLSLPISDDRRNGNQTAYLLGFLTQIIALTIISGCLLSLSRGIHFPMPRFAHIAIAGMWGTIGVISAVVAMPFSARRRAR